MIGRCRPTCTFVGGSRGKDGDDAEKKNADDRRRYGDTVFQRLVSPKTSALRILSSQILHGRRRLMAAPRCRFMVNCILVNI
jgi:hypothetical protein